MNNQAKWILLLVVGVVLGGVAVGLYRGPTKLASNSALTASPDGSMSIVFLTNGEVYIGNLTVESNTLFLSNPFLLTLQRSGDKLNYQLTAVKDAKLWSSDRLIISSKSFLYYAPLNEQSEILKDIEKARNGGNIAQ